MEFHEKLQELRKSRGLTQEELANALYVSRTAVSKWESGRGYPSIDSLKQLAVFYSVSIDDLLSADKAISLAERENSRNLKRMRERLFGAVDLCSLLLIVLPLYPKPVAGHVYAVSLFDYSEKTGAGRMLYWCLFATLLAMGAAKLLLTERGVEKGQQLVTAGSMWVGILTVLLLAMAREAYATAVAFLLFVLKGMLYRCEASSAPPTVEKEE